MFIIWFIEIHKYLILQIHKGIYETKHAEHKMQGCFYIFYIKYVIYHVFFFPRIFWWILLLWSLQVRSKICSWNPIGMTINNRPYSWFFFSLIFWTSKYQSFFRVISFFVFCLSLKFSPSLLQKINSQNFFIIHVF